MKKLIVLFLTTLTTTVNAAYVLWVGVDEHSVLYDGISTHNLLNWTATWGVAKEDISVRVCLNGEPLKLGYEDPSGYMPPGQTRPTIIFDDPVWGASYEVALFMGDWDDNDNWVANDDPMDWQPVLLDADGQYPPPSVDDPNQKITIEIGYSNDNTDWEFVKMAESEARTLYSMFQKYEFSENNVEFPHAYISGSLAPPIEDPWHPEFFTIYPMDVPEPSTGMLFFVGTIFLFIRKRK